MNNLIIGGRVYNEEHKFLKQWLEKYSKLTNKIVIIDDGSTDNSVSICSKYTSYIYETNHLFKDETPKLNNLLWNYCTKIANNNDFILIIDNDELMTEKSIEHFEEQIYNCNKLDGDSISWAKYDMWNQTQYREDPPLWMAHRMLWTWCVKYKKNYNYYWDNIKIHSILIPINSFYSNYPTKLQIQHMAYSTPELRLAHRKFYDELDKKGEWDSIEKYNSILDENPTLIDFKDNFEDTE